MDPAPAKTDSSAVRHARVVVAEDDFEMRRLVADCLRKEGYEVHEVADGDQLLVRIEDSYFLRRVPMPVDLFVTDIRMPVYTGLEIVSGLREAGLTTPVIIMTAFGNAETRERAEALGATLLDKPFKLEQLRGLVRRVLHSDSLVQEDKHPGAEDEAPDRGRH
ncbi:MAG: response regulator [Polyangiaceae bacterium]